MSKSDKVDLIAEIESVEIDLDFMKGKNGFESMEKKYEADLKKMKSFYAKLK